MRSSYYIRFNPAAKIDYLHLLAFYDLAEYRKETKAFDTIRYSSITDLAKRLNLSSSTVSRILKNTEYKDFIEVDKENKVIRLLCSFPKGEKNAFVNLSAEEVKLLKDKKDNLLSHYLIYLKYYCGYTKEKKTDFTAIQFLSACGYSIKSKQNFDRVSSYNKLLTEKGLIKIEKYRDELGHTRNKYSFL